MMKKLLRNTVAAAGFAALLLVGACAHNDGLNDQTNTSDDLVQVRPEETGSPATVAPAPGPAKVDSDGNIYSSSAAPGTGNPSGVGTNTNVNIIPEKSTVQVTERTTLVEPAPVIETTTTETTITETTTEPMTSSVQETTTTTETETRTRMRKD
ncbi:MAG TPA: hypothetical protein VGQ36_19715 [Thermoanaerobaculia bacterium]|jgi:hypothetical protein|nr:hypothetical protein [Thermoanaerobaculia bacterium]